MKSFFTSSLDKIDALEPYVNAMAWDSYRSQFRTGQSGKSGNRNCVLASGSLNPESTELTHAASQSIDFPLIVQNTLAKNATLESRTENRPLSAFDVDECFGAGDIEFIEERRESWVEVSWLETSSLESQASYDEELSLLESVQEIAIALARTTPKRTILEKEQAN